MKVLVNKHNPAIRITAPEITTAHPPVSNEGYVYWIPAINQMYSPIDWTLVEEEIEKDTIELTFDDVEVLMRELRAIPYWTKNNPMCVDIWNKIKKLKGGSK